MNTLLKYLRKICLIIQEFKFFYIFFRRIDKSEREIVFYSEDIVSYSYFEGLIDYITNNENLKICYITSEFSDPILSQEKTNIKSFYLKWLVPFFTVILDSKVLVMTMPDLHQFHIRRSIRGAHHVYLFHSINSTHMVYRHGAFDHYDTIFCIGPHHIKEIRRSEELYGLPRKALVDFGYYRVEKIFAYYHKNESVKNTPATRKSRILVAPSWGDNNILDCCGDNLISILLQSNYEVIVRPHPVTWTKKPELLQSLCSKFGNYKNFSLENDISSITSLQDADLLISDWSGVAFEYAFGTERPVVFIDTPRKANNPHYMDFDLPPLEVEMRTRIGVVLGIEEIENIDSVITQLFKDRPEYKKEIANARMDFIYNFGNSSRIGAEYIRNICTNDI